MSSTGDSDWIQAINRFADSVANVAQDIARRSARARGFWTRLTDGLAIHEIWRQFRAETQSSYRLYSADLDWDAVNRQKGWKRTWHIGRGVFWAVIVKLTPARRVLLLIALALVVVAVVSVPNDLVVAAVAALLLLLALELADRVTMKRDLEIARDIQRWLVPSEPPKIEGVDIAFATRPANTVSGDYYDAFPRERDGQPPALLIVVADVAGKSVPAALLMATIQASLRTLATTPASLVDLVLGLNRYACAHSLGGQRFTTAFIAEFELATNTLAYVSAGHNPPVLRRASGEMERLEEGGLPLGIFPDACYECGTVTLDRGDLLAVVTDGVAEAESPTGEQYGELRLIELLKARPQGTAAEQVRRLLRSVDAFAGNARQHDDITCLFLWLPPA